MIPAPDTVVIDGAPAHGRYTGSIPAIDWSALKPRPGWLWRRLHHKRWHYVGLGNDAVFIRWSQAPMFRALGKFLRPEAPARTE